MTVSPADAGSWRRAERGGCPGGPPCGEPRIGGPPVGRSNRTDRLGWAPNSSRAAPSGKGGRQGPRQPGARYAPAGATAARPPPLPPPAAWPACRLLPPLRAEGILLAFRDAIDNWEDVYEGRRLQGWAACKPGSCVPVCSWSGVTCDPYAQGDDENRVTAV